MNESEITTGGLRGGRPGREATTGANVPAGGGGPRRGSAEPQEPAPVTRPGTDPRRKRRGRRRDEPEFRSYYDLPVINKPVWEAPDIPGYLFLGGLAGGSALIGAAAHVTGRRRLATAAKTAAAAAGHLSLLALVHDLGRRGRFLNMLRVFKVTSPMSVGSWLLAGFVPAASAAALSGITGRLRPVGAAATAASAALGGPVGAYTAVLIADTAVPAWHDGHRLMPFVFVSSGLSAAAGLGLLAAPADETAPLRTLAAGSGLAEVVLSKVMEHTMGLSGEAYRTGRARKLMRAAEALTLGGAALAVVRPHRRLPAAAAGAALVAGSALARFGIFEAGMASAEDPKYTVVPQRERLERAKARAGGPGGHGGAEAGR
jgi:formate-dependent nitrite reductase membrane component NrfD